MYDIFYLNEKPNLFEFETKANSISDAAKKSKTERFWIIDRCYYDLQNFDFHWKPIVSQRTYNHGFSDQWSRDIGVYLYLTEKVDEVFAWNEVRTPPTFFNWRVLHDIDTYSFDFSWHPSLDDPEPYIYVFGNQWYPAEVMPTLEYHVLGATNRKYINELRCRLKQDKTNWEIPDGVSDDFDFSWLPTRYDDQPYIYQFSSQWQKDGGPRYVMPGATEVKYVDIMRTKVSHAADIFYVDKGNASNEYHFSMLKERFPYIQRTRFINTTLDTMRRCASKSATDKFWYISSETCYDDFDFTWHGDTWQKHMNHIFGSQWNNWSETCFLNKYDLMNSSWCNDVFKLPNINFVKDITTTELVQDKINVLIYHGKDDLVSTINELAITNNHAVVHPHALKVDYDNIVKNLNEWDSKNVVILSDAGSTMLIPKAIKKYNITNIYDYPYIVKADTLLKEQELDIIYISNNEPNAEELLAHLIKTSNRNVSCISNIDGRSEALKKAAQQSQTEWFFGVNAKLEVDKGFDWSWQPDYLENPKHYIFSAINPVNKLVYGHMALVAYNKKLVLETDQVDLDFTQTKPHEVLPIISGIGRFNIDPIIAWRTAFREIIKLMYYQKIQPNKQTEFRLSTWKNRINGANADWVKRGVDDAIGYFNEVHGDLNQLKLSYSWTWLDDKFIKLGYKEII